MLTYLLIIFVIALALAPLGHFFPSKRQREIARMREYAAVHGLFVEFRNVPAVGGVATPARDVIYYGKRLLVSRGSPVETASWVKTEDSWRSAGRRLPVPAQLHDLPQEILAASMDQSSCGVYWREAGGEERVEQIRETLERWSDALLR